MVVLVVFEGTIIYLLAYGKSNPQYELWAAVMLLLSIILLGILEGGRLVALGFVFATMIPLAVWGLFAAGVDAWYVHLLAIFLIALLGVAMVFEELRRPKG